VETLRALAALADARLEKAARLALADAEPRLRAEGRRQLARLRPAEGLSALAAALETGTVIERQQAFEALGAVKGDRSEAILAAWLDRLTQGKVPAEVRLDLVEAAQMHAGAGLK